MVLMSLICVRAAFPASGSPQDRQQPHADVLIDNFAPSDAREVQKMKTPADRRILYFTPQCSQATTHNKKAVRDRPEPLVSFW